MKRRECYEEKIFREDKAAKQIIYFLGLQQKTSGITSDDKRCRIRKPLIRKENESLIFGETSFSPLRALKIRFVIKTVGTAPKKVRNGESGRNTGTMKCYPAE